MAKISFVTLGCPKNIVDSDNLIGDLKGEGFSYAENPDDADMIFVNTCGFIEDAKRESIEEIIKLKHYKEEGKKLFVFGCLAKRYRDELVKEIPEIDGIWGVGEEKKIIEYCMSVNSQHSAVSSQKMIKKRRTTGDYRLSTDSYAYLKIAEGCNRGCTFCVIPSIRGPFRSFDSEKILRKAEEHIKNGAKELIIIAQDIGSYRNESNGHNLPSLLKDIASISGDFWIRLLYLYPTAISDELLSVIALNEKICRYIDMPLQHSEDKVLRAMGRGGTKASYVNLMRKIREAMPDVVLRTTFIVGFPGETEDDFIGLKEFVKEMKFDRLGVFTYSKEEGTPAAEMKGSVPKKTMERRRNEIMEIQSHISLEKNKALIGKRFRALVDEIDGEITVGRLYSHAPEIDGVVIIEEGHRARGKGQGKAGEFVNVEIIEAYDYDLKGKIVT